METLIEKRSFVQRFLIPVGIMLVTMILSLVLYYNSYAIGGKALHPLIANVFGVVLWISIGFGSLFVYPSMFFRGASGGERVLGSLITPIVWTLKELVRVSEFFTLGETLYYGLSSIFLLIFIGSLGLMGICELICRVIVKRKSAVPIKVVTPLPVLGIVFGLIAFYVIFIWGVGVHWFYIYQEGYKALFH
jgi:hypothetical protein